MQLYFHLDMSRRRRASPGAKSADTDVMAGDADASASIRSRRVGCQEDT